MKKITKIFASVFALLLVCVGAIGLVGCKDKENKAEGLVAEGLVIGGLTFEQKSISIPTKTYNAQKLVGNAYVDDYTKSCAVVSIEYEVSNNTESIQALKPSLFTRYVQLFDSHWSNKQYEVTSQSTGVLYKNDNEEYKVEYVSTRYYFHPYDSYFKTIEGNYNLNQEIHQPIIIIPGETAKFEIP